MSTIYDIAKKAGVSPATVSKVFNNYSEVSKRTKEKVQKVANDMGYIPNISAQMLKTNKSFLVGVMFSEGVGIGLEHRFFSTVLESFRKEIGRFGYDTVFINKTVGDAEIGYLEHSNYRNVDGMFIITALENDVNVNKLKESNLKCVTTDIKYEGIPMISSDNIEGGRLAVKYLYDNGHRRIAHLSGPLNTLSAIDRLQGYRKAVGELGITYDPKQYIESGHYGYDAAYQATETLLGRFTASERPTAIFVGADIMAFGAYKAIKDSGLRIPEDISIVGFDDLSSCKFVSPELTTIAQNKILIGREVADTLVRLMNLETVKEKKRIPVKLIERASVKALKI